MSRYLYSQDEHNSGKNSCNYIGDYWKDGLSMFEECLILAKKHKCDGWICGGDFLHSVQIENHLLDEFIDRIEKEKLPFYFLYGNHNEYYRNQEYTQIKSSMAHALRRSKYFNYLDHLKKEGDKGYSIVGIDYSHDIEENIKKNGINFSDDSDKCWKIAIVHAFVCPKEFLFASHVVCDDVKTNADLVLVAHYHKEWEKKVGNTLFKDIGCLGRRSITERDIKPSVLLIDTDKREIKEIFLKSAKQAKEIFDLTKIEELKEKEHDLDNFVKSIEDIEFQKSSLKDTVKFIGKEKNVNKEVIDLILNKMEKIDENSN